MLEITVKTLDSQSRVFNVPDDRQPNMSVGDSRTEIQIHITPQGATQHTRTTRSMTRPLHPTANVRPRMPQQRGPPRPVPSEPRRQRNQIKFLLTQLEQHIVALESGNLEPTQPSEEQATTSESGSSSTTEAGSSTSQSENAGSSVDAQPSNGEQASTPGNEDPPRHPTLLEFGRFSRRVLELETRFLPFLTEYTEFLDKDTAFSSTESPEYKKTSSFITTILKVQRALGLIHRTMSMFAIPLSDIPPRSMLIQGHCPGHAGLPQGARQVQNIASAGSYLASQPQVRHTHQIPGQFVRVRFPNQVGMLVFFGPLGPQVPPGVLLYLNVKGNSIIRPAIEQIRKTIWVEKIVDDFDIDKVHGLPPRIVGGKLMLDVDQPTTQAYEFSCDEAEAKKLDESIRESLSAPVYKGELIGPAGGSINLLDCEADYPPNAFQKKTSVRHSVRSSYHDAPEGFVVCSPVFGCTTFKNPFEGSVTITLPLHIIPEDGQVVILKRKGCDSSWVEFLTCPVNEKDRTVTFQVSHFCSFIACTLNSLLDRFRGRVHLSHYLFYRPETWQLITLTCIDQSSMKTKCVAEYMNRGFTKTQPLPDKIVLHNDEYIAYRYICIEPDTSRVSPDVEISISKRDVVDYLTPTFLRLQPKPPPDQDSVIGRVIRPPHGPEKRSEIVLENKNQRSRKNAGGIDRSFPQQEPAGTARTEENTAAGGIVPGSGESAQGSFFGAETIAKHIWQGGGASNPVVMDEATGAGTSVDLGAGTSVDLPNIAPGAGEAEGSVATGGNVPAGAGSLEGSLLGAGGNFADVVGSELGSAGNVLAGGAAAVQHEFAKTIPVQETGDDTFVDLLTEASSAGEAEGNVAAGGIVPGSSEPVVESSLGEITATGAMLTSSSTVPLEEMRPGASENIPRCGREFYERHSGMHGTYPFPLNRPKGKVKIINNKFLGQGHRWKIRGTEVDIRNLETLLRNLGLLVDIEEDLTAEEMCSSCAEFARNIGDVSSVFLIILSHGGMQNGQECIYGNDKCMVQSEKIISYFTTHNCPHLTGIPKVFMFEACRGSLREEHRVRAGPGSQVYVPPSSGRLDMLIVYPSQSGYVSWYDEQTGSWLIEAFTYIFSRHAHDTDVGRMLTMVNRRIAGRISSRGDVQASNQENYLTKDLYLFPGINDVS